MLVVDDYEIAWHFKFTSRFPVKLANGLICKVEEAWSWSIFMHQWFIPWTIWQLKFCFIGIFADICSYFLPAIPTVVTIAEILKRKGLAIEKSKTHSISYVIVGGICTSYVVTDSYCLEMQQE